MAKTGAKKYNVYDDGKLIIANAINGEIIKALGCTTISIQQYAENKTRYRGRYSFEIVGVVETAEDSFVREWNAAVARFKNVIWVKNGGRKLTAPL